MALHYYTPNSVKNGSFGEFLFEKIECSSFQNIVKDASVLDELVNPEFDNVLPCPGSKTSEKSYEIDIHKENTEGYYKITKYEIPLNFTTRFGCELETCFVLNCTPESLENLDEAERVMRGFRDPLMAGYGWLKLIYFHLKYNIIPRLSSEFLRRFEYVQLAPAWVSDKYVLTVDLKNGNVVEKIPNNETKDDYKTLIFTPDGSIICNNDMLVEGSSPLTVPCEIITPILESLEDLRVLYDGLIGDDCHEANHTMGFHVNVSAVQSERTVELSPSMLMELIYTWIPYEKKYYTKYRGDNSDYANKILLEQNGKMIKYWIKWNGIKSIDDQMIDKPQLYQPYGLAGKYLVNSVNNDKFLAMTHHKNNNVIEFRMYAAQREIETLMKYTSEAIGVFTKSLQNYCDNYIEILARIQQHNMFYKRINEYVGTSKLPSEIHLSNRIQDFTKLMEHLNNYDVSLVSVSYETTSFLFFTSYHTLSHSQLMWQDPDILMNVNYECKVLHKNLTSKVVYYTYNLRKSDKEIVLDNLKEI